MMKQRNGEIFSESEWARLEKELELSPRQVEIVQLLCDGHKNYSAALALGISVHTVRTHLRQLYTKLDVSDRFEMLCLLVRTSHNICHP